MYPKSSELQFRHLFVELFLQEVNFSLHGVEGATFSYDLSTPCEDAISIESKQTVTKNPALTTFAPSQQMKSVGTVRTGRVEEGENLSLAERAVSTRGRHRLCTQ